MPKATYAVVGITADPLTWAPLCMTEAALEYGFSKVVVVPCSQGRATKSLVASSMERLLQTYAGFADLKRKYPGRILISDRFVHERSEVVSLTQLRVLNSHDPRPYYLCVGADNVRPVDGNPETSFIEYFWKQGRTLWSDTHWAIFPRPGYPHPSTFRCPPHHIIIDCDMPAVSSTEVRDRMRNELAWEHFVPPMVIERFRKYNPYI